MAGFYNGGGFIIDAVTAAGINGAILYAIWRLVLYIAYGPKHPMGTKSEEEQKVESEHEEQRARETQNSHRSIAYLAITYAILAIGFTLFYN